MIVVFGTKGGGFCKVQSRDSQDLVHEEGIAEGFTYDYDAPNLLLLVFVCEGEMCLRHPLMKELEMLKVERRVESWKAVWAVPTTVGSRSKSIRLARLGRGPRRLLIRSRSWYGPLYKRARIARRRAIYTFGLVLITLKSSVS